MAASKRVETAKKQRTEVSQPPAAAPSPSSPSSPSFAPSSVTTPAPPFPFHALPAAAGDRLQGYLGFALLMDLRCLSRAACRQLEDAALQWMNHRLLVSVAETTSAVTTGRAPAWAVTPSPPPFCFNRMDAVWFRQQLSRWRFDCVRADAEHCTLGAADAHRVYGETSTALVRRGRSVKLTPSYYVKDAVGPLVRTRSRAENATTPLHALARALEQSRMSAPATFALTGPKRDKAWRNYDALMAQEKAAARWWRGSWPFPAPMLLLLPTAVVHHSILPHLDFEHLMQLRLLSHSLTPVLEAAAITRLSQLCPAGLATIVRQQAEEAHAVVEKQRVKTEKEKEKRERRKKKKPEEARQSLKKEDEQKETKSRKRKWADDSASPPASAAPSASVLSSPAAPFSFSSSSSSTASSCSSGSSSASPPASYTVAHCVWAMQQLQWCRRLASNSKYTPWRPRVNPPVLSKTQFLSRFSVNRFPGLRAQWKKHFGSVTRSRWGFRLLTRQPIFDVLDLLLGLHGRDVGGSRESRTRKQKRAAAAGSAEGSASVQEAQPAGCPTLVSTNGRLRCARCTQITK